MNLSRRNKIKSCLEFSPKKCTEVHAWSTGHRAIGSMLTTADLSENEIQEFSDLSHHRYLESLILHSNKIQEIQGLSKLQYLQVD